MDFEHVCGLKNDPKKILIPREKIYFLNFTAVDENKSPCSIQSWDLLVSKPRQHLLCHRDRQRFWHCQYKRFHNALKLPGCDVLS